MKDVALFKRHPKTKEETYLTVVGNRLTIGKSSSADVNIRDIRSSGIHALIEKDIESNVIKLVDLCSEFGTYRKGKKIKEIELDTDDTFEIGNHIFVLKEYKSSTFSGQGQIDQSEKTDINLIREKKSKREKGTHLQVEFYWGEKKLDLRTFSKGSDIFLGHQRESTFPVTFMDPKLQKTPFRFARFKGRKVHLDIPAEASGLIWINNDPISLDRIRHEKKGSELGHLKLTLKQGDRAAVSFGEMTIVFHFVGQADRVTGRIPTHLDRNLLTIMSLVILFYLLLFLFLGTTSVEKKTTTLQDVPKHLKKVLWKAGIEKALSQKRAALGQLAQSLEGGRARSEEGKAKTKTKPEEKSKPTQKPKNKKSADSTKKKEAKKTQKIAKNKPQALDLDAAFSSASQNSDSVKTALPGKIQDGNTAAALSEGGYARGSKGLGAGGGGNSVGIGELKGSSSGGAMGASDYGLTPRQGREIRVPEQEEIVILGGLDPEIIAAYIKRYLPQIQNCYEQGLAQNSKLNGKVKVAFVIGGDGSVVNASIAESSLYHPDTENCIVKKVKGWKFPKPRGNGTVGVRYPFLLMSNSGG